ncbi:hypothetical protein ACW7BH_13595, partial [Klebsiella pneumoniae]
MGIAMRKLCYFINSDWYFDLHWIDGNDSNL